MTSFAEVGRSEFEPPLPQLQHYATVQCLCEKHVVCVFFTPQYSSSLNSWGGAAVGFPDLALISSRTDPPTEMSISSNWMLLLSRIRMTSACWDFTYREVRPHVTEPSGTAPNHTTSNIVCVCVSVKHYARVLPGEGTLSHHKQ